MGTRDSAPSPHDPEPEEIPPLDIDYAVPLTAEQIAQGGHRERVGRRWRQLGRLQLAFLKEQGLKPEHLLLDVGCGALRGGVRCVRYLKPRHYYGIDINESLLDAGYDRELPERLRAKLPRDHLRTTARFDCEFGVRFDYAIAQSVFTHLPLNHIRLCLYRVAEVMQPGGRFFATFFEAPPGIALDAPIPGAKGGKWTERDPFYYWASDLSWAAGFAPWEFVYVGEWGHPVGQMMVEFRRKPDVPDAGAVGRIVRRLSGAGRAKRRLHR